MTIALEIDIAPDNWITGPECTKISSLAAPLLGEIGVQHTTLYATETERIWNSPSSQPASQNVPTIVDVIPHFHRCYSQEHTRISHQTSCYRAQ